MTTYVSFTADPSTHTELREALKHDFAFRFEVDDITFECTTESFETYLLERIYDQSFDFEAVVLNAEIESYTYFLSFERKYYSSYYFDVGLYEFCVPVTLGPDASLRYRLPEHRRRELVETIKARRRFLSELSPPNPHPLIPPDKATAFAPAGTSEPVADTRPHTKGST